MTDVLDKYEALHLEATPAPFTVEMDEERAVALVRLAGARGVYPSQRAPIERDIDFDGGPQEAEARATAHLLAASRNTVPEVIELAKAVGDARGRLYEWLYKPDREPNEDRTIVIAEVHESMSATLDAFLSALSKEVK